MRISVSDHTEIFLVMKTAMEEVSRRSSEFSQATVDSEAKAEIRHTLKKGKYGFCRFSGNETPPEVERREWYIFFYTPPPLASKFHKQVTD